MEWQRTLNGTELLLDGMATNVERNKIAIGRDLNGCLTKV
jgi:hypothetical protein